MEPERSRRLIELFGRAAELEPAARAALLARECGDDDELRRRVERLLEDDASSAPLLEGFDSLQALDRADPMVGQQLGAYRLTARVARGGMGVVYRAERTDGVFDRDVAIKLIRVDELSPEVQGRFELERRALARLDHEGIARLYDGGTSPDGRPYFVMEFVEGVAIDAYCDREQLDVAGRLRLFATVCRAVQFAHQNLIVHRDLKPSNILVDGGGAPKLVDFGIARVFEEGQRELERHTRTVARRLTPEYASPEQLAGRTVTTATDVYSLGVVLYGLLTGRLPFQLTEGGPVEWERQVLERAPTRPSAQVQRVVELDGETRSAEDLAGARATTVPRLRRSLAGDLDRIVLMALRKEPERRYQSPAELADDIERHLDGRAVLARGESLAYTLSRFARRHRVAVAAAVLVLASLVIGIVAAREGERRAQEQALHARIEADSFARISTFLTDTFLRTNQTLSSEQRQRAVDDIRDYAANVRIEHADEVHLQANLLDVLGQLQGRLGRFEEGEQLLREALDLRVESFGRQSLEVALSLRSLGQLEFRRGRFREAAGHLREALELHRTCPLGTHTDVASAANDLASALRNLGQTEEAERLHREALALRRDSDDGSPAVAESLNNLAGVLLERGELADAEAMLREALEIRTEVLGAGALATGQTLANLAQARWGQGAVEEARELLAAAVELFRELHEHGRDDLGTALSNLATIDMGQARWDEAEARLSEAVDLQVAMHGPDHPDVADTLRNLAALQRERGLGEEARLTLEEVLRIRRGALAEDSPLLGRTLQELGTHLMSVDAHGEALEALRESVAILAGPPVSHELWLARAEVSLARCLLHEGEPEQGRELLVRGAARMEAAAGASASELAFVRGRLAALDEGD